MSVAVSTRGPFFEPGAREEAMAMLARGAREEVGSQGLAEVHHNLDASIRHPTPYYETQITLQDRAGEAIVHDRGVIYGPWLEGTGSRNRTTRFKGYASFRRATQELRGKVGALIERHARDAVRRLS